RSLLSRTIWPAKARRGPRMPASCAWKARSTSSTRATSCTSASTSERAAGALGRVGVDRYAVAAAVLGGVERNVRTRQDLLQRVTLSADRNTQRHGNNARRIFAVGAAQTTGRDRVADLLGQGPCPLQGRLRQEHRELFP